MFSVIEYPDERKYSLTCQLLNKTPTIKQFKYNTKNKLDVRMDLLKHIHSLRCTYNLPGSMLTWDSLNVQIVKTKFEQCLETTGLSKETIIGFYAADYPETKKVRLGYSINGDRRKYKDFKYTKCGLDEVKHAVAKFMNDIRVENGLARSAVAWDGLNHTFMEVQ